MWIGLVRNSGEVPAWSFILKEKASIDPLKGILQKVVIETKTRNLKSEAKEEDANWLQAAVIADDEDI